MDQGLHRIYNQLVCHAMRKQAYIWQRELIDNVCSMWPMSIQKSKQDKICRMLALAWSIDVQLNRKSQKALAIEMVKEICCLETISEDIREALLKIIEDKESFSKRLMLISVV